MRDVRSDRPAIPVFENRAFVGFERVRGVDGAVQGGGKVREARVGVDFVEEGEEGGGGLIDGECVRGIVEVVVKMVVRCCC